MVAISRKKKSTPDIFWKHWTLIFYFLKLLQFSMTLKSKVLKYFDFASNFMQVKSNNFWIRAELSQDFHPLSNLNFYSDLPLQLGNGQSFFPRKALRVYLFSTKSSPATSRYRNWNETKTLKNSKLKYQIRQASVTSCVCYSLISACVCWWARVCFVLSFSLLMIFLKLLLFFLFTFFHRA